MSWELLFVGTTWCVDHDSLAVIIVALTMMENISRWLCPLDHQILMAWIWMCKDCVPDDRCFAAGLARGGGNSGDFVLGGVLRAPSLDFRGENPRSDLHWLYLIMTNIFLDECIVWSLLGLSSGWKPMIWWSGDDGVYARFPSWRRRL
jgi:hypothetical protein